MNARAKTVSLLAAIALAAGACSSNAGATSGGGEGRMLSVDDVGLEWVVDEETQGSMFGMNCQHPQRAADRAGTVERSNVISDTGDRIMHIRTTTDDPTALYDQIVELVSDCDWRPNGNGSAGERAQRWQTAATEIETVVELVEGDGAVHYFLAHSGNYLPASLVDTLVDG